MLHHIIFITACAQNVHIQHERKRWTLTLLANSTFHSHWPKAAHSLLMRHFSSSTNDLKINMIIVKYVTYFQRFCGFGDFLSRRMCSPVWIHCCKRPNYDFCVLQGSV